MTSGNPFADFGGVIGEGRFLGRRSELTELESRLLGEKAFGSVALIGMPRTGKTSLIRELVRRNKARCIELGILVVRVEVGSFNSAEDLFRGIVEEIFDESTGESFVGDDLMNQVERVRADNDYSFSAVRRIFRQFRRRSLRILCILDEFDAGRYLLQGTPEVFHWIRELSSTPEIKGSIVLISKRSLHEIARLSGHDSDYWSNVLMSVILKGFSGEDFALWVERIGQEGIVLSEECMNAVELWCGRNPFLLDVFSFKAWEAIRRDVELNREWVADVMKEEAARYYKQVVTVLQDGDALRKVQQVVVGPQWDISAEDLRTLCEYGILVETGGGVKGFCEGFEDFLAFIRKDVEIWPLWSETEGGLRSYLEERLIERFGDHWVPSLKAAQPKLAPILNTCECNAEKERKKYGAHASTCLLDYSYPLDLYRIMCADWMALGGPLLGADKKGWAAKLTLLSRVRTPIAHNRGEVIEKGEMKQAEGFCTEILYRLKQFEQAGLDN